jgi:hypothetical protein
MNDTLETPEFQRQSRDFAAAVQAAGNRCGSSSRRATITSRSMRRCQSLRILRSRGAGADETQARVGNTFAHTARRQPPMSELIKLGPIAGGQVHRH